MIFDFKCNKCNSVFEYSTSKSLPKEMNPPEDMVCTSCKEGLLEKQFSVTGQISDVIGGYEYIYGKKAWKKHLTVEQQADVLLGGRSPY